MVLGEKLAEARFLNRRAIQQQQEFRSPLVIQDEPRLTGKSLLGLFARAAKDELGRGHSLLLGGNPD